ncbi:hypothetical protein C0J52_21420 [Blattella germanica]|nr:hypothetical protein C0J52_21420 [Blattella germanica]
MKYENIKKRCKRKFADEKQELYKTGGGTSVATKITHVDNIVQQMIGECGTGLLPVLDSDDVPTPRHNWATWNPVALKEQISAALVADVDIEEFENTEAEDPIRGEEHKNMKKIDLTTDCRLKYAKLSDARSELIKLQIESAKQDICFKREEHERKMEYMKREFELSQ